MFGFLFTIFGDELEPFGKIRDAAIALASGITAVGLAKAKEIGSLIGNIRVLSNDSDRNSSFAILLVVTYFIAGFYFMYLMRKLALNPALADAKRAADRLQNTSTVSIIASRISEKLRPSLLLGRESIDLEELDPEEIKALNADIASDEVENFLKACDDDARKGIQIQFETVALAARVHYYRFGLIPENTEARRIQELKAIEWITRTLSRDPTNPEFQMKLADTYLARGRYDEAASIIERLERDDNSPQYIQQWLGYFLLFVDGREADAIKQSLTFHDRFTDESSGLFNASCGYAQLYTIELRHLKLKSKVDSTNRSASLKYLEESTRVDSNLKALALKHSEPGASFESLASDEEFQALVGGQ